MAESDLLPIAEAYPKAGFRSARGFLQYCRRDADAPRLITMSPRKHFVLRPAFEQWLAERLEGRVAA